jgi:hypothetical protein
VITTPAMNDQIEDVHVFKGSLTQVASDHYPVIVKVRSDAPTTNERAPRASKR